MAGTLKCSVVFIGLTCTASLFAAAHPLDDLSKEEIIKAVQVIKASGTFTADIRFPILLAHEPAKEKLLASKDGEGLHREAKAVVFEKIKNEVWETIVDLTSGTIVSNRRINNVQPPILLEEYARLNKVVHADPQWQAAMKKRGLENFDDLWVDGWAPGLLSPDEQKKGARIMRGLTYFKGNRNNFYGRPIEGVVATVDMNADKVIEVLDLEMVPLPKTPVELDENSNKPLRDAPNAIVLTQPDGPTFKVTGQRIEWQNWSFRFNLQPMKGLTLYQVSYNDHGKVRPILYKACLSEMTVPYGDPAKTWSFRNAFDVGEYGVGRTAQPLQPLADVPANAVFFDSWYADDFGVPVQIPRAVALYERDGGVLWKHLDQNTGVAETRRARDLVLTFTSTIGNYDYSLNWVFHQEGSIDLEANLTGMLLAKGTDITRNPCTKECKRLAEPLIITPNHQHFFCFRLDFDIDGSQNTAAEMDVKAVEPGKDNPDANAFEFINTLVKTEGGRDHLPEFARHWKIMNPSVTNALGHPTGYMLVPGEVSVPYLHESSPIRARAGYLDHPVWFTRYDDEQQSAAGEYPNQSAGHDGLREWANQKKPLENQDVVMWYTFGVTHIPRPEEWPIMSTHRTGFKLMPLNFFSRNPSMDVPAISKEKVEDAIKNTKVYPSETR